MLFSVESEPYDLSYQKWTARWWQWALSIPKNANPLTDITEDSELISQTAKDIDQCGLLEATVDGIKLLNLQNYRIQYGPFDLDLPADNIWNVRMGPTRAVSDGFWLFLKPLSEGDHTIEFHGIEPHFETHVRYHITVKA